MFDWIVDWVYELLYKISRSIYQLIDGLMACANMLVGIEPIKYQGVETDFMTFLMRNENVVFGFAGAAVIGVILVFIFAVFAMMRAIVSEKSNMTPLQIVVKVGKTLLTFIFIPLCMVVLIYLTNIVMQALYKATLGGSPDGIGRFLAGAFGVNARKEGVSSNFYLEAGFDYTSIDSVKNYLNLADYDFFFSYIGGICVLISLATSLLMFVDRAISMIILFILSPISLSTAVIDDGAHFKLWRDQFLVKFLTGYGCIIAINIYVLIIAAICDDGLEFFENYWLNNLMKIAIIIGGAVSMQRTMALVGNLISAGAGSNELRDNAIATAGMKSIAGGALGFAGKALKSPFTATRSIANFASDSSQYGLGTAIGQRLGFRTKRDYGAMSRTQLGQHMKQQNRQLTAQNNARKESNNEMANIIGDKVSQAIAGIGGNNNNNNANNGNKATPNNNNKGNAMVNNAINNSLTGKSKDDSGIGRRPKL